MHYGLPYKTKQFFFVLIKLSIVVGAFYFIYTKISENDNLEFSTFVDFLRENNTFSFKNILFLVILSGFNWFFEILKWEKLVGTIKKITFKNAMEQSLAGLTTSLITPNRIGDYGAKAVYYPKPFRKRIVLLNLLSNMAQMTITVILGCIGFIVFVNQHPIEIDYYKISRFGLLLIIIGIFTIFGIKYKPLIIKGYSLQRIINYIKEMPTKTHILNLFLSFLRYLIFSFQFYYLLTTFGVFIGYSTAMVVITSMYLLASIVPSISIFDVVIKGSIAVYLFDFLAVNELTILSIIAVMWILNFAIPSGLGSYYVLNFKFPKTQAE